MINNVPFLNPIVPANDVNVTTTCVIDPLGANQPVAGPFGLAANDGAEGIGPDFVSCVFVENNLTVPTCQIGILNNFVDDQVRAAGTDEGDLDDGEFAGLPSTASTSTRVFVNCCGDGVVNQTTETCDTNPQGSVPDTAPECPTCPTGITNACRAPGATDQCTICGDAILQATSGETCDFAAPIGTVNNPGPNECLGTCVTTTTTTSTSTSSSTSTSTSSSTSSSSSSTSTSTTSSTSTTVTSTSLPARHFQCYEIKPFSFNPPPPTVADRCDLTGTTVRLTAPNRLCAPSSKQIGDGPIEDPTAPSNPEHLAAYLTHTPLGGRIPNQTINSQFGTVKVDLIRRSLLMVPAAKGFAPNPVPDLVNPTVNHFQCYAVRRSPGAPRFQKIPGITGVDQFGSHTMDLLRPRFFCLPANKNNEDPTAPNDLDGLLCYRARHREPFSEARPSINDQFFASERPIRLIKRWEFCVPARVIDDSGECSGVD